MVRYLEKVLTATAGHRDSYVEFGGVGGRRDRHTSRDPAMQNHGWIIARQMLYAQCRHTLI